MMTELFGQDDPYVRFLIDRRDTLVYRKPYPGNSGDRLIMTGTDRLMEHVGMCQTVDPAKAQFVLMAGGNPTLWPTGGIQLWRKVLSDNPQAGLVLGPCTYRRRRRDWIDYLNDPAVPVQGLFARDPESYEVLRTEIRRDDCTIGLSHDPAFFLKRTDWLAAHRDAATRQHILGAFRNDQEGAVPSPSWFRSIYPLLIPKARRLIQRQIRRGLRKRKIDHAAKRGSNDCPFLERDVSHSNPEIFVETIRAAAEVHTDRLHVMIMAALLGKPVFAYGTSFGKLEAIYNHSMVDWADVTFVTVE